MKSAQQPALTDSSSRALLAAPPARTLLQSTHPYKYDEVDGFLRLPSRRKQATESQDYRSITVSRPNEVDSDSDPSSSEDESSNPSSDEEPGSYRLTSHQQTIKSLEERLREYPRSIETWLSLLQQSVSSIPFTSKNASRTRSEVAVSILSRALDSHRENRRSRTLRIKFLRAGEGIWHERKLRAEWEDALELGDTELWMQWLDWRAHDATKGLDGIIADARRVLSAFKQDEEDEVVKCRVLWRMATLLKGMGYVERGTALLQAQAEL